MDYYASQRPSPLSSQAAKDVASPFVRVLRTLGSVWPFIALAIVQTALAIGSLQMLGALRAFSSAENQWSKGQKDAVYALSHYATTGNVEAYEQFHQGLRVPMSDMQARKLIEAEGRKAYPQASLLLLQGGNEPEEIKGLIWLSERLRDTDMMRTLMERWRNSDEALLELQTLAGNIHSSVQLGAPSHEQQQSWLAQINALQKQLASAEQNFSQQLGDASRGLKVVLWAINIGGALAMLVLLMWHTSRLQRDTKDAEDELGVVSERATTTLAAIGDAVITTNEAGDVLYLNKAAEQLLGSSTEQLLMRNLADQLRAPPAEPGAPMVQAAILDALSGKALSSDTLFTIYDSHQRARQIKIAYTPIGAHTGTQEAVFVFHDVSQEQTFMRELAWQATHDQLTGLVNRYEFERRLGLLLQQPAQADNCRGAMMYLDLDQFKVINDTSGHSAGDAMLRAISTMLQHGLRAEDTLARVGGDEFAILLEHCPFEVAVELAEQIRDAAQHVRLQWGERSLSSSISIGLVKLVAPLDSVEEVFRVADMASYGAKQRGRNTVYAYDPLVDQEIARHVGEMEWLERIKAALENDLFILHAQPIQALNSAADQTAGHGQHIEIQMRMRMPDGSLISPVHFIPAAERYGLMPLVDRWVVSKTLATLAQMQKDWPVMPISCCAINLSGTTLGDEKLLDFLRHQIEQHGVNPRILCFEITETAAITHLPNAIRLVKALKALGCKFSMDDFGSGVSSFGSLKNLPVDFLKIDGAIVADMRREPAHRAMVEAINHLSHALGMKTIAEFAATPEIVDMLRQMGVDYAQGYAIGAPKPFPGVSATPAVAAQAVASAQTSANTALSSPRFKAA
ncbi:putative bifunctional diguanylate cyclase/phosphodiesterase [Comamonas sp. J-3]|uniref:putative bifunctional diguanylate cyclase/phosphodiesterase n=1 Tax=Comamonas trifloxystrobinivorans TaxID=3350256 RepID=UPI0037272EB7